MTLIRDLTLITFGMWSSVLVIWLAMWSYGDQTATQFAMYGTMLYFMVCFVVCLVVLVVVYGNKYQETGDTL